MKLKVLNTMQAPHFFLSVIGILLLMGLSAHAGESVISPLSSQDVSEFYAKHLDKVDDVDLLLGYSKVKKVEEGTLVRTILRGKVVFAGKSELLGKVVVVKHAGNVHTVYWHMSQIAPTIRVGVKMLQGYVVGKTSERFGFRVTKRGTMKVLDNLKKLEGI